MSKINSKVLFPAYTMASALRGQEAVSSPLQPPAEECGNAWADYEMQETREFLGRHQQELADAYDQGGFAPFDAAVMLAIHEDEEREAARGGEACSPSPSSRRPGGTISRAAPARWSTS